MNVSNTIEGELQQHRLVHIYGPSIDLSMLRILDIVQVLSEGIVFCVLKTNELTRDAYNMATTVEGQGGAIGLATGDRPVHEAPQYDLNTNRVIYCTSGKMRNILIDLIKRGRTEKIGWILIQSWDEYDANAYVIANLGRLNTTIPITLLSCSEWCPLPYTDSVQVEYPYAGHLIEYTKKTGSDLASLIQEEGIFYGPEAEMSSLRDKGIVHLLHPGYSEFHLVIDTLKDAKKRPITKHIADLRSDTIRVGTVYRQGTQGHFEALRPRDPIRPDASLEDVIVYLKHEEIDPMGALGTNHPEEEVLRISATLDSSVAKSSDLGKILSLRLSTSSGIFYMKWLSLFPEGLKKDSPREGRTKKKSLSSEEISPGEGRRERDRYIPGLIACLIEYPPTRYAPVASYEKFVGRNDIETLCNVWSSLILSYSGPFWTWTRDRPIHTWCSENGFYFKMISKLIYSMKRICLGMKGEGGLFDNIKTGELNMATEVFRQLETGDKKINWNKSNILPSRHVTSNKNILPVLHKDRMLDIYIDRSRILTKPTVRAEDVSMFYDM